MKGCDFEELRRDFEEAVSRVDFKKYDPYSREFMKALFIGQMHMAAKSLCDEDDVEEELDGAEKYYEVYSRTGDAAYKDMASDELRHAGTLIKKHLAKATDEDRRAELNAHEKRRQEMLKVVSAARTEA